jgi:hypothetical protein
MMKGMTRFRAFRRRRATTQKPGEDTYQFLARGWWWYGTRDLPAIYYMRADTDPAQAQAIQLYATLRMVKWTRALVFATLVLGACTIIAAIIVA